MLLSKAGFGQPLTLKHLITKIHSNNWIIVSIVNSYLELTLYLHCETTIQLYIEAASTNIPLLFTVLRHVAFGLPFLIAMSNADFK